MKEIKILSMDARGRILIPQSLRSIVGFSTNSKFMVMADSESKIIKIAPLSLSGDQQTLKLEITMSDSPGALGKIASTLGELGLSIIHSEGTILEKNRTATYTAIVQGQEYTEEELKSNIIKEGAALDVRISYFEKE